MFDGIHGKYSRLPISLSIVELLVDMDCQGCEKKVRRAISKLHGVDTVEIDMVRQKVTVAGYVDRDKVLKMVKRTTEVWPYAYNGYYDDSYQRENTFSSIGKYNVDDFQDRDHNNSSMNGYYLRPSQKVEATTIDQNAHHLFCDDNANACSIM